MATYKNLTYNENLTLKVDDDNYFAALFHSLDSAGRGSFSLDSPKPELTVSVAKLDPMPNDNLAKLLTIWGVLIKKNKSTYLHHSAKDFLNVFDGATVADAAIKPYSTMLTTYVLPGKYWKGKHDLIGMAAIEPALSLIRKLEILKRKWDDLEYKMS